MCSAAAAEAPPLTSGPIARPCQVVPAIKMVWLLRAGDEVVDFHGCCPQTSTWHNVAQRLSCSISHFHDFEKTAFECFDHAAAKCLLASRCLCFLFPAVLSIKM